MKYMLLECDSKDVYESSTWKFCGWYGSIKAARANVKKQVLDQYDFTFGDERVGEDNEWGSTFAIVEVHSFIKGVPIVSLDAKVVRVGEPRPDKDGEL